MYYDLTDTAPKNVNHSSRVNRITADFICFVYDAIFTTDEDRRTHLEKETHGKLHDDVTKKPTRLALEHQRLNEERKHHI
jgi:hypothetical protein